MTDSSHLIKKRNKDDSEGLLEKEKGSTQPEEAKEILDKMLHISELIKDVSQYILLVTKNIFFSHHHLPSFILHMN